MSELHESSDEMLAKIEKSVEALINENKALRKELESLKGGEQEKEIAFLKKQLAALKEANQALLQQEEAYRSKINHIHGITNLYTGQASDQVDAPTSKQVAAGPKEEATAGKTIPQKAVPQKAVPEKAVPEKPAPQKSEVKEERANKQGNFPSEFENDFNPFGNDDEMLSDEEFSKQQWDT